jgi:hypothetical protein
MNIARKFALVLVGSASCLLFTGCTKEYTFEFTGTVTNATNGNPLSGVKVFLVDNLSDLSSDEDMDMDTDIVTKEDGSFSFQEKIRGGTETRYLVFSKKGFRRKAVKLHLRAEGKEPIRVKVAVKLAKNK